MPVYLAVAMLLLSTMSMPLVPGVFMNTVPAAELLEPAASPNALTTPVNAEVLAMTAMRPPPPPLPTLSIDPASSVPLPARAVAVI